MTVSAAIGISATPASHVLGRKLDSIPFAGYHMVLIVVLGFVGFIEGYDLALSGSLLVLAKGPLHLGPEEVRSLAVAPEARGQGFNVGDRLMKAALDTARRRKIARLFAVTHRPEFFSRYGFVPGPRQAVPEKVERDCVGCPKERKCTLVAAVAVVCPERDLLVGEQRRKYPDTNKTIHGPIERRFR